MKTIFRSVFLCSILFILACGAGETPPKTTDVIDKTSLSSGKDSLVGVVRSMQTKALLDSVHIFGPAFPGQTTNTDGRFVVPLAHRDSLQITYTRPGYYPLQQTYIDLTYLKKIVVYMEDSITQDTKTKSLSGRTFRIITSGGAIEPVDSILVIDEATKDSIFTNLNGLYLFNLTKGNPTFEYQFKNISMFDSIYSMTVKNLSDIKDSSKLDIIFDGTITGIDIELEPDTIPIGTRE